MPSENAAKLIVVVGLPGSGKTTYMQTLRESGDVDELFDDFQADTYGHEKDPQFSRHFGTLLAALKAGKIVAISDIRYCAHTELHKLLAAVLAVTPELELDVRYFENNPKLCERNVKKRRRKDRVATELRLIQELTTQYKVPETHILQVSDV